MIDLTLRCPTCGVRADMCFAHGEEWKKPNRADRFPHRMTEHELRASMNEFTADDPPPYGGTMRCPECGDPLELGHDCLAVPCQEPERSSLVDGEAL